MLLWAFISEIALMLLVPVAALLLLLRLWGPAGVPVPVVGAGALAFFASQLLHLPFNWAVAALFKRHHLPLPPAGLRLPLLAAGLGLSAGLFEESARLVVLRHVVPRARSFRQAVALGLGHGGFESMLMGLLAAVTLINMLVARGMDLSATGLGGAELAKARAQVAAFWATPPYIALLAAAERLMAMLLHVAASTLVMLAVVRGRGGPFVLAVLLHATVDGAAVYAVQRGGILAAEGVTLLLMLPTGLAIRTAWRRLPATVTPDPTADAEPPPPAGPEQADFPVEIRGASKVFPGPVRALDGCTFVMRRGSRHCLLGPNGAGKTTMMRLLTGALTPSAGVVRLWGAHSREPAFLSAKRRVGIVPQQPGMYRDTTAGEWLRFVQRLYGRGDPDEVARMLGLTASLDRRMADLSGGTQRRLAMAAALLPGPELLLLDEPTVGLDPVAASEVRSYLQQAMVGRTVLLCTHNLAEAEELCSDVVILRAGRVLLHEPIAALKQRTAARLALACRQGPAALTEALGRLGHTAVAEPAHGEVSLTLPDPEAAAPELLRALLAAGLDVYGCRVVRSSLEDLFLDILREQHVVEGRDAADSA